MREASMKPEEIIKLIESGLITAEDYVKYTGPGSSQDLVLFTTTCKNCGIKVEQPLRWYDQREARCPCGGEYDMTPLIEATKRMVRGGSPYVEGIRRLPKREDGSGGDN